RLAGLAAVGGQHDRDATVDRNRLGRLEEAAAARDVLQLGGDAPAAQQLQSHRKAEADARILPLFLPRHVDEHATKRPQQTASVADACYQWARHEPGA